MSLLINVSKIRFNFWEPKQSFAPVESFDPTGQTDHDHLIRHRFLGLGSEGLINEIFLQIILHNEPSEANNTKTFRS